MDKTLYLDYFIRLLLSLLCGILLGIERKSKQHAVGIRTLILISLSSCLLTILSFVLSSIKLGTSSLNVAQGDCTRIAAGIVTGIGFLGAGAIIQSGNNIKGLTTAAVIWSAAALGIAAGAGEYLITIITLLIILLSLKVFKVIEYRFFPAEKSKILTITYSNGIEIDKIKTLLTSEHLILHDTNITYIIDKKINVLKFLIKIPNDYDFTLLIKNISSMGVITRISIDDK